MQFSLEITRGLRPAPATPGTGAVGGRGELLRMTNPCNFARPSVFREARNTAGAGDPRFDGPLGFSY